MVYVGEIQDQQERIQAINIRNSAVNVKEINIQISR